MNPAFWNGKRVFVTGHTGFKGGWLVLWLRRLGAEVTGFALAPPTTPNLFQTARIAHQAASVLGDIRDLAALTGAVEAARPEILFHLAAQPIVRRSYDDPVGTYSTNVMGTVHVMEAARRSRVRVMVNVTSDKCYENRNQQEGYREHDPMGGSDPYSSSKGCAELVAAAYGRSFFREIAMASGRAGNVIGGGDWAEDRLLPDCVRALTADRPVVLRNPDAVRPWQHVLEPLHGYLLLAEHLWTLPSYDPAQPGFNFGPPPADAWPVGRVVEKFLEVWGSGEVEVQLSRDAKKEAALLTLDSSLAQSTLGWHPRLDVAQALVWTAEWYRSFGESADILRLTLDQIAAYERLVEAASLSRDTQTAR